MRLSSLLFLGCGGIATLQSAEKPNFVFILVDDLAFDALESSGRYPFLETPNINRLQREGASFENFFCTMSLSSPSRACFLTGVYPHIHGVTQNDRAVDPNWKKYKPYPQILQETGYETAMVGKMHSAELWGKEQVRPGFDYYLGFRGQGEYFNPLLNENGIEFRAEGYMTDLLTTYAEQWLQKRPQKNKKPFSLCLWHKAVHMPFSPSPKHKNLFIHDSLPLPPRGNGVETYDGKPEWQRYKKTFDKISDRDPQWDPKFKQPIDILETLLSVDESIGKILSLLTEMGELDNTVIVFSSDNGYFMGEHGYWDKRISYEESMRIPFIIRYPKLITPNLKISEMCLNIDLAPTFLDWAGASIPDYVQGKSMSPLFNRKKSTTWRKSFLFEYYVDDVYPYAGPTQVAVRTNRYKLIDCDLTNDIDELYDLKNDPGEMTNLIQDKKYNSIQKKLRRELERLKKEFAYTPDRDHWLRQVAPKWQRGPKN